MILHVFKERFEQIEAYEIQFGVTLRRSQTLREVAAQGKVHETALNNPALVDLAKSTEWSSPILMPSSERVMPAGTNGENAGPT